MQTKPKRKVWVTYQQRKHNSIKCSSITTLWWVNRTYTQTNRTCMDRIHLLASNSNLVNPNSLEDSKNLPISLNSNQVCSECNNLEFNYHLECSNLECKCQVCSNLLGCNNHLACNPPLEDPSEKKIINSRPIFNKTVQQWIFKHISQLT